jgi:hypothetical protein
LSKLHYNQARMHVLKEQHVMVPGHGYVPVCPYCWQDGDYRTPTNAHHFLIKRSDVQGWKEEDRKLADVPANLVMLCTDCDARYERTSWFTYWCVEYKAELGYHLEAWLDSLPFKVTSHRRRYLNETNIRKHLEASGELLESRTGEGSEQDLGWRRDYGLSVSKGGSKGQLAGDPETGL